MVFHDLYMCFFILDKERTQFKKDVKVWQSHKSTLNKTTDLPTEHVNTPLMGRKRVASRREVDKEMPFQLKVTIIILSSSAVTSLVAMCVVIAIYNRRSTTPGTVIHIQE